MASEGKAGDDEDAAVPASLAQQAKLLKQA
jgi:hypothetical protein